VHVRLCIAKGAIPSVGEQRPNKSGERKPAVALADGEQRVASREWRVQNQERRASAHRSCGNAIATVFADTRSAVC